MTEKSQYCGGWTPDPPDLSHKKYATIADPVLLAQPNPSANLKRYFNGVMGQESLNCCTACACLGAYECELGRAQGEPISKYFSFSFVYYNQRALQRTLPQNTGASISDGLFTLNHHGVCTEDKWPEHFQQIAQRPPKACYDDALNNRIGAYYQLDQDIIQMKACLSEGHPFIFGFWAYGSAKEAPHGHIPMPGENDSLAFGHAMVAIGYDDKKQLFNVRNSWTNDWGDNGYGTIPYAYLTRKNLSHDFWTIRLDSIETAQEP